VDSLISIIKSEIPGNAVPGTRKQAVADICGFILGDLALRKVTGVQNMSSCSKTVEVSFYGA
jgi:hypothetical protein